MKDMALRSDLTLFEKKFQFSQNMWFLSALVHGVDVAGLVTRRHCWLITPSFFKGLVSDITELSVVMIKSFGLKKKKSIFENSLCCSVCVCVCVCVCVYYSK